VLPEALPKGVLARDCIAVCYGVDSGNGRTYSGFTVVWRAAAGNAAGARIFLPLAMVADAMPKIVPDVPAAALQLDAWATTITPPVGTWAVGRFPERGPLLQWTASWDRPGAKIQTRDDHEGRAPDLRPEDMRWLRGPAQPRELPPPQILDAKTYEATLAAHPGVQAFYARYRDGWAYQPIVFAIPLAEPPGFLMGDVVIGVDGRAVGSGGDIYGLSWDTPHRFRFSRRGGKPQEVELPAKNRRLCVFEAPSEPALAVLAANGSIAEAAVLDVLAVIRGLDQPALAATAASRLSGVLEAESLTFIKAWIASANEDFAGADALLATCSPKDAKLSREASLLREANRYRSGCVFWGQDELARDQQILDDLRHILRGLPVQERFAIFAGAIDSKPFSVDARAQLETRHEADTLLGDAGGRLGTSGKPNTTMARFGQLPEHVLLTTTFTIAAAPDPVRTDPEAGLCIQFMTKASMSSRSARCSVTTDGRVFAAPAQLDTRRASESWQQLPIIVAADGRTRNNLRVVKSGQLHRVEINGHAVIQGFLPLLQDPKHSYALDFEVRRDCTQAEFSQMLWLTHGGTAAPSNF